MPAEDLLRALAAIPRRSDPNVLVGTETGDDAAVYRLDRERAIVETLDFFTPVVDDPYDFGRVAAANALSDVYAMGGRPLFALNIVAFPVKRLGAEMLGLVLAGGEAVCAEAGIPVLGGHSVDDPEPKYGLVVTGLVHPDRLVRNTGARAGDVLFLTKPLGSGILTTAVKAGKLSPGATAEVVHVMTTLNRGAAEAMTAVGVHAATDVTGFGLLGHLTGMLRGSGLSAELWFDALPFLPGVVETAAAGVCPGGSRQNLSYFGACTEFDAALTEPQRLAVADAQTSGGLLVACPPERADALEAAFRQAGTLAAARVGRVVAGAPERIRVRAR